MSLPGTLRNVLVVVELFHYPPEHYWGLQAALGKLEAFLVCRNVWLLSTSLTRDDLLDVIVRNTDYLDAVFVIEVTDRISARAALQDDVRNWLASHAAADINDEGGGSSASDK